MLDTDAVRPDSSPSLSARVLAFAAIIVAGACGGLIGYSVMDLGCDEGCATPAALVGLAAAVAVASGTGIVAVLVLRATAEWRAGQLRGAAGRPSISEGS